MNKINEAGVYPFWDLIVEETYNSHDKVLKEGTWGKFQENELENDIYMFGCNDASRIFIELYKGQFHIRGILDNAKDKWGTTFCGLEVLPPAETIQSLSEQTAVIVIAMRLNADSVIAQLKSLGFQHYYGLGVLVSGMEPYATLVKDIERIKLEEPVQDIVIFESTNDFDGNSGALYEYLKKNNSHHKFVWIVKEEANKKLLLDTNDIVLCPRMSIEDLKQYLYYRAVSKWQIWDNHSIRKVRNDQTNVFLQHFGMGYKQIANIFNSPGYVDYVLTTNENVYEFEKHALLYAENTKIIFGELPRNDVLFSGKWRELEKLTNMAYDKTIMWAPTLRNSKLFNRIDSDLEYPLGISLIYTEDEMNRLNEFLTQRNILLLVKIHPRQRCNYKSGAYSNILYLDGESVKRVHAYKLLTQMDAMITDYSSIVFDYMLLDRPIAWVLEDIEHYRVPFLMENPLDFMPGHKIYKFQDLLTFIQHVKDGKDPYKEERNRLSQQYNARKEGKGCENLAKILGL